MQLKNATAPAYDNNLSIAAKGDPDQSKDPGSVAGPDEKVVEARSKSCFGK